MCAAEWRAFVAGRRIVALFNVGAAVELARAEGLTAAQIRTYVNRALNSDHHMEEAIKVAEA